MALFKFGDRIVRNTKQNIGEHAPDAKAVPFGLRGTVLHVEGRRIMVQWDKRVDFSSGYYENYDHIEYDNIWRIPGWAIMHEAMISEEPYGDLVYKIREMEQRFKERTTKCGA